MKTATARARIEPEVKERAEHILQDLGLSVSSAFEIFYRQIILKNGLPFEVQLPNEITQNAIRSSQAGEGEKFCSADELFDDLGI